VIWWLTIAGCIEAQYAPIEESIEKPASLSESALVRRLSFDLRGIPPSLDDLAAVEEDAEGWVGVRNEYLSDERLGERMVHLYAEKWHTRVDVFDIVAFDYGLDASMEYAFERAVGEEPLRILSRVITEDLPWSEIVTADWTMSNQILGSIWPLDYAADQTGWQVSHYTDGRPAAGVLSTNGLWWRYTTTSSNMNRGRAATISRLLLCEDYLDRPVAFSEADTSETTTADAAQEDPYCLACHASLDPVAASLFGFWWLSLYSEIEETTYHAERESLWDAYLGVAPAWYGTPISGLPDLGVSVANDSRFYACAVETLAEGLWRRNTTNEDTNILEDLRVQFLRSDTTIRPLIAAITETESYRDPTPRMLSHDQLISSLDRLTGFRWTQDGFDQLDSDESGYRLLAGGVDGVTIKTPQKDPGLTWALVVKRAAEAAASHAVDTELIAQGERKLFTKVTLSDRPNDSGFIEELESLHLRLYGTHASTVWTDQVSNLWTEIEATEGSQSAWRATISVLLRDPAFMTY
jgi:hypothetical protein